MQGAEKGVVVAFPSALLTAPRPTARMTAGAPTCRDVGQIYLVLVRGCVQTAEIPSCPSFPASGWRQSNSS